MRQFLSIILVLVFLPAFSCEKDSLFSKNKWSAGIILLNTNYTADFGFQPNILPGIIVRRDLGKCRLRGATEIRFYQDRPNRYMYPDESYISHQVFGTKLRLGIERGWKMREWMRPYFGADLAGAFTKTKITDAGGIMGLYSTSLSKEKSVGFLPTAGIEFMLGEHLSVSAETQFGLLFVDEYELTTYYVGNIDTRPVQSSRFDFTYERPVSVAMHFHF